MQCLTLFIFLISVHCNNMSKAEHEIREAYLMQHMVDLQHSMEDHPLHQHSDLVSYPEKWDWREKGFVTDVRK